VGNYANRRAGIERCVFGGRVQGSTEGFAERKTGAKNIRDEGDVHSREMEPAKTPGENSFQSHSRSGKRNRLKVSRRQSESPDRQVSRVRGESAGEWLGGNRYLTSGTLASGSSAREVGQESSIDRAARHSNLSLSLALILRIRNVRGAPISFSKLLSKLSFLPEGGNTGKVRQPVPPLLRALKEKGKGTLLAHASRPSLRLTTRLSLRAVVGKEVCSLSIIRYVIRTSVFGVVSPSFSLSLSPKHAACSLHTFVKRKTFAAPLLRVSLSEGDRHEMHCARNFPNFILCPIAERPILPFSCEGD